MDNITCEIPALDNFIVRANVPLPHGFNKELCILDQDNLPVPTQRTSVIYYPDGSDAVIKLSANISRKNLIPNTKFSFKIVEQQSPKGRLNIPQNLQDLVLNKQIKLRYKDVFNNTYEAKLGGPAKEIYELGPASITVQYNSKFNTINTGLPYFGGLQSWLTGRHNSDILEIALNIHNGSIDPALYHLYFKSLELLIPIGWFVLHEWPEPTFSNNFEVQDGFRVFRLIQPNGKSHILPQRREREWRMYLFPDGKLLQALEIAQQKGFGIASGWWKHGCYFTQFIKIPNLTNVSNFASQRKNVLRHQLQEGLPDNQSGGGLGQIGYFNPAGVSYGGMTGGLDVHQFDGIEAMHSMDSDGLLVHRIQMRRYTDRQMGCIYTPFGQIIQLENYLNRDGSIPWELSNSMFGPWGYGLRDKPFNFSQADQSHEQYILNNQLEPDYKNDLLSYGPIDEQHLVRRLKDLKVLVWLDNDPLAKHHLGMLAELCRMSYYEKSNGTVAWLYDYANTHRGLGHGWGRGEAWLTDCITSYYACSQHRERWLSWLKKVCDSLILIQGQNGVWQRNNSGKAANDPPFSGKYSVCRSNEHTFMIYAVNGLLYTVFNRQDQSRALTCHSMIRKSSLGLLKLLWGWAPDNSGPAHGGPWGRVAVGPFDLNSPMFKNHSEHPPEQFMANIDAWHVASALGFALKEFRKSDLRNLIMKAIKIHALNVENPLVYFLSAGYQQIDSRANLISELQNGINSQ